jgi:hypothetical protein
VIYRAFRATSSAALDVESHLLPIAQQIEKQNTHTLSRIMSYQAVLELGNILRVGPTGNSRIPTYTSLLRSTYRRYKDKNPTNVYAIETIPSFVTPP